MMVSFTEGTTKIHLKVVKISKEPSPVLDHQVPIFIEDQHMFRSEQWDLTTYQVTSSKLTSVVMLLICIWNMTGSDLSYTD